MKLPNSVLPKSTFAPLQLNRLYNVKLHVFKFSGERTYSSDNENIHHAKFAWYAERSSFADISLESYHLITFEPVNPLLHMYLPSFKCRIFFERSEVYVAIVIW